jgi:hypothetical protein
MYTQAGKAMKNGFIFKVFDPSPKVPNNLYAFPARFTPFATNYTLA